MEKIIHSDNSSADSADNILSHLKADTIDGVIHSLDRIIAWSKQHKKQTGYFAALYRKVTVRVRDGIQHGEFENGERMEKLDVIFANRYLEAFEAYCHQQPTTCVWQLAFELGEKWSPIVLQHLMIGMNAHINLDLGIAAAQTVDHAELPSLKTDFDNINTLLASLVNEVQDELAHIWPPFKWIDRFAGKTDEALADWGMKQARDQAWQFALDYAAATDKQQSLDCMDKKMYLLGLLLAKPSLRMRLILLGIRLAEHGGIPRKIEILE